MQGRASILVAGVQVGTCFDELLHERACCAATMKKVVEQTETEGKRLKSAL
jgi:hypothetical protein